MTQHGSRSENYNGLIDNFLFRSAPDNQPLAHMVIPALDAYLARSASTSHQWQDVLKLPNRPVNRNQIAVLVER